ncbi:unnamed protein product, partial [Trichogramma brassicae]
MIFEHLTNKDFYAICLAATDPIPTMDVSYFIKSIFHFLIRINKLKKIGIVPRPFAFLLLRNESVWNGRTSETNRDVKIAQISSRVARSNT